MRNFQEILKNLRLSKGLTQKQLADALKIRERQYQTYEAFKETAFHKPSFDMLIALADYFNVSLDYLVGRSDDPTRH